MDLLELGKPSWQGETQNLDSISPSFPLTISDCRQIGKMLNATEPKIVNGPEILDKYVGEAEKNIRNLFIDAEADEARLGANSPLHIIIFDEIDAICKKRGSVAGSSGVNDTVVNQLLSKIDGVDTLNNILVIGMTNWPDMIDEALTRPGRLEVIPSNWSIEGCSSFYLLGEHRDWSPQRAWSSADYQHPHPDHGAAQEDGQGRRPARAGHPH